MHWPVSSLLECLVKATPETFKSAMESVPEIPQIKQQMLTYFHLLSYC